MKPSFGLEKHIISEQRAGTCGVRTVEFSDAYQQQHFLGEKHDKWKLCSAFQEGFSSSEEEHKFRKNH